MENYEEKVCCLALGKALGSEPRIAVALVEKLGSAKAVCSLSAKDQEELLGPYARTFRLMGRVDLEDAAKELDSLEKYGSRYVCITEKEYPQNLKECEDPPVGLYLRGSSATAGIFDAGRPFISIVGTRNMTQYGEVWCNRIVEALAQTDKRPTIVSGLAYGIDITAHKKALECGLPTIACMATGVDSVYPWRHIPVAESICKSADSALVSDFQLGCAPLRPNFLRRNRIIAGLSQVTVIVESKAKGGAMVTSDLAFSYGREVYALPGRADDVCSLGCNRLIKAKMAEAIYDENSFLESIGLISKERPCNRRSSIKDILAKMYSNSRSQEEIKIMEIIMNEIIKDRGASIDEICGRSGLSHRQVSIYSALLEGDGLISIDLLQRCSALIK